MASTPPLSPHDHAEKLVKLVAENRDLNEADTRHQIIDCLLHDVLSWPRPAVRCESFINPGYSDYILFGRRDRQLIFIEAKKIGHFFKLPAKFNSKDKCRFVQLKSLMTDRVVAKAVNQVRTYCVDRGCEYAAITNGNQWIFFKTFARDQDWRLISAFVVEHISFFAENFSQATEHFSYNSINIKASLATLFGDSLVDHRPRYYPKEKIISYDQKVLPNYLNSAMRPIVQRYFAEMTADDSPFMERCYVRTREYTTTEGNVRQLIHDTLSPYFKDYNVKEFFEDGAGGQFGQRINSSARERRTRDVMVLFGGKGAGKSTFTNRLLFHKPPHSIHYFCKIAIVNLLRCPELQGEIFKETWGQVITGLDADNVLGKPRSELLTLFADRFEIATRQSLAGLDETSEAYNVTLNGLVDEWKADLPYVAACIADYWKKRMKGLVVVLDNTDQYEIETQEYCFTLAQNIAEKLDCLVVISMREERFHSSSIHGTLDAFSNSGFHLSSPNVSKLFWLRCAYVLDVLSNPEQARKVAVDLTDDQIGSMSTLFRIFKREFGRPESHLNRFVKACVHGNMRLALELFREFALSGYLQVGEMLAEPAWKLQAHQVLRPMMVPYRAYYSEDKSKIPNVYQIRSDTRGSHFTSLRILRMLSTSASHANSAYVSLANIKAAFSEKFNMLDDAKRCLDVFLAGGLIESNNRIDQYSEAIDSVKLTGYGKYVAETLAHNFSYLDLVCLDCAVHDQGVADALVGFGNKEQELENKRDRMILRMDKVRLFLDYLRREEEVERTIFGLDGSDPCIMNDILACYEEDLTKVKKSFSRNRRLKKKFGDDTNVDDAGGGRGSP